MQLEIDGVDSGVYCMLWNNRNKYISVPVYKYERTTLT